MQTGESKKCLKAGKVNDLSVPPGFTSRTAFILKRIASDEGTQKIAPLKNLEDSALETNLQIKRRAWIVHDELDNHEKEPDDRPSHESAINTCSGKLVKQLICLDKLLLTFAQKAVKSRWDYLFRGVKTPEVIRLKDACGKGSDIAVALKARVKEEARQREFLCTKSQSRKMEKCFDEGERKECCICSSVLYLSAAFCPCNRNRFACLKHAKKLCSCAWSSKVFHFRFSHDQLNLLVEATEGKFSAVHKWVKEDMACARENGEPNINVIVIPDNDSSTERALEHKGETNFSSANCDDNDDARRKAELSETMARILGVPSFDCTGSKLFDTFAEVDSSGSSSESDHERSFLLELKVKKPLAESHSASNGQVSGSLHEGKETKSSGKPEVICLSSSGDEGGDKKCLNSELWHACAGPLVCLPTAGSRVVYFPQGHSEQVAATTNKDVDGHIPNYPNLPPQLICQLHNVTMHADVETDEVYAQMTLQPLSPQEQKDIYLPVELGIPSRQPTNYFCKTLTASDTSTHGGFSVPRRAAEKVFPPLDFSQQPPCQELIARDLHDVEWKFKHIFRGQPKRHLLTTGWSVFVSAKRLVAGDSVLFIWNEKNQLFLGIRHATRPQNAMPSSVISSDSMHIGLLAAAVHAAATNSCFTIFFNPRASPSEFVIPLAKYVKAAFHTRVSVGMRFRMLFETEESSVRRYMGTITAISDLDPVRWPNSHWRSVKVGWDESTAGERQPRVSLWEIEPLTTFPMYPSLFPLRLKRPWHGGASSLQGSIDDPTNSLMWLRGDAAERGLNFQSLGTLPWMQPRVDQLLALGNQNPQYQAAMMSSGFQNLQRGDSLSSQLLQFQQPLHHLQQSSNHQIHPSIMQQILHGQQISKDNNMSHAVLSQDFYKQQEGSSSQQQHCTPQEAFQQLPQNNELQQQRLQFSKADIMGSASSELHIQSGDHQSAGLNEQSPHQLLTSLSSYSTLSAYTDSLSLPPYPGRDVSLASGNVGLDMQQHNFFNTNADSSGLMLPMTMHNSFQTTNDTTGIESIQSGASGFQNSMYGGMVSSPELQSRAQVDVPTTTTPIFVKVYKTDSVGRSLDISRFSSYHQLREELGQMFGIEGKLEDPLRSGWQLVFVDRENELLLLGDDPWESFVNNVWYIKILSPDDMQKLEKQETDSYS